MNENVVVAAKEEDEGIVLVPEQDNINIIPTPEEALRFDERFKNRKSRRTFMKMLNNDRVERSFKVVVDPNTSKRSKKRIVKTSQTEPKLRWDLMPKFTKAMSEQYSEACGIVFGWRNPDKLGIVRKHTGETIAL